MATLASPFLTLTDIAKQTNPDGTVAPIVELLAQMNEMVPEIPWMEGNLTSGHRTSVRTKLPEVYLRKLNQGTRISKGGSNQIDETISLLEGWSEVDEEILKLSTNQAQTRLNEDSGFFESMNQKCQELFIYGSQGNDESEFNGFAQRYATVQGTDAGQVIDGGGTGTDNTSIWLVGWSPQTVMGIYGKNGVGGLQHFDRGVQVINGVDSGNNPTRQVVHQSQFIWNLGLCVRDYRYVVRIANIDVSNLKTGTGAADLITLLTQAMERIYSLSGVRPAFYANRTVREALRLQQVNKTTNSTLGYDEVYGRPAVTAGGIPIRLVDRILSTEARVV